MNAPKEKGVLAFMIFHDMLSPKGAGGPLWSERNVIL